MKNNLILKNFYLKIISEKKNQSIIFKIKKNFILFYIQIGKTFYIYY